MQLSGPVSQAKAAPTLAPNRQAMLELFRKRPLPDEELMVNLGLYIRSGALARLLFLNEIYQMIVPIPGIVCEFGVWWGQTLAVFENLRAVYEPYNYTRRVIGFDTFTGYLGIGDADKRSATISEGVYGVPEGYETYLDQILACHEKENVTGHIAKHELIKGDAVKTVPDYFNKHPEQLLALAFFDMAIYEPTKAALEAIKPRLMKGSVIAFDELRLHNFEVRRSRFLPDRTLFVVK